MGNAETAFRWPEGYVWRSHLGGWVTPEQALADSRRHFRRFVMVGPLEIGLDPDPAYQPEKVGSWTLPADAS